MIGAGNRKYLDLINFLIINSADVNERNRFGQAALHEAVKIET